jgi:hypothetical protein
VVQFCRRSRDIRRQRYLALFHVEVSKVMSLPTDDKARKALPIFDGCVMYFPDALLAVAEVSRIGNEQHNPGEPLHWARGKSMDQFNTGLRHQMDHRLGQRYDSDGGRHLAKAAWRILAALQLDIEAERASNTFDPSNALIEELLRQ